MEAARKRRAGSEELAEEETKAKRRGGGGGGGATEEEVEAFFAILRRAREAKRRSAVRDGGVKGKRDTWHPKFVREDFEVESAVRDDGGKVGVARGFDLNAEPAAEVVAESETGR